MTDLRHKMSEAHEHDLAEWLGGRQAKGSGNQFNDQMDGRHDRYQQRFSFAWDGKATRGKSISVTRAMWDKAVEQAGGERPMLPLRFYDTDRLAIGEDLAVVGLHDLIEMRDIAIELADRLEHIRKIVNEHEDANLAIGQINGIFS